ncbi:hypothetical protein KVT40_005513 [Elsinoe batatas]|uniref:Uncharacterized protein n=1 Tax=Elsinoe batatas TaxID=2601811 RepID=A0A8K0L1N9_9PEZI|nr:hypothetical protein KVT40_005513 [Elsinoe batatas]
MPSGSDVEIFVRRIVAAPNAFYFQDFSGRLLDFRSVEDRGHIKWQIWFQVLVANPGLTGPTPGVMALPLLRSRRPRRFVPALQEAFTTRNFFFKNWEDGRMAADRGGYRYFYFGTCRNSVQSVPIASEAPVREGEHRVVSATAILPLVTFSHWYVAWQASEASGGSLMKRERFSASVWRKAERESLFA